MNCDREKIRGRNFPGGIFIFSRSWGTEKELEAAFFFSFVSSQSLIINEHCMRCCIYILIFFALSFFLLSAVVVPYRTVLLQ